MLGPPGSGKGTQAKLLAKELNIPAISTGQIFRNAIKTNTELGKQVKERMDAGILIDDDNLNFFLNEFSNNVYFMENYKIYKKNIAVNDFNL